MYCQIPTRHDKMGGTYAGDWQILDPPGVGVKDAETSNQEEDDDANQSVDDGKERVGQGAADESGHEGPVERDW